MFASVGCADGFYPTTIHCRYQDTADTCTACTVVAGALEAATYSCTNPINSRVSACAATTAKTIGADAQNKDGSTTGLQDSMDTCTATCAVGTWDGRDYYINPIGNNVCTTCQTVANAATDATYSCTYAGDSRVSACASDAFKTVGADGAQGTNDVCTTCTTVVGSTGAITCTSASDSRVANCIAGQFKTEGAADAPDTCTVCTAVADSPRVICTAADASIPVVCNNGFYTVRCFEWSLFLSSGVVDY